MRSAFERLAAGHDRRLKEARLSSKRTMWAYQDAKRGSRPVRRPQSTQRRDDVLTLGLVIVIVVALILAASN